jgi:phospholipid/cholesterol/gamma-HCH transport system substrate-binding protein
MSTRFHNILVGLTVLVGLMLLGGMIFWFAGMPEALRGGYQVHIHMPDSGGAKVGDTATLRGLPVGKLTDVAFVSSDPSQGVNLTLHIDNGINLPVGTKAYISQGLLGGGTSISLAGGAGKPFLPADNTAVIQGEVSGLDLGKMAQSLEKLSDGLSSMLGTEEPAPGAGTTQGGATTGPARPNLQNVVAHLDEALASLNKVVGDQENQQNIKASLKNLKVFLEKGTATMEEARQLAKDIHTTADKANGTFDSLTMATTKASGDIDQLSRALLSDTDRLTQSLLKDTEDASRTLNGLDRAIAALSSGQGTAGKLITDPHLYNNLVDVSDQMSSLMKEAREMLQQWKDKGVPLKLK